MEPEPAIVETDEPVEESVVLPPKPEVDIYSWEFKLANSYNSIGEYRPSYATFEEQGINSRILQPAMDFLQAARNAGFNVWCSTALRNYEYLDYHFQSFRFSKAKDALDAANRMLGPGLNEHQTGLAIDFTDKMDLSAFYHEFEDDYMKDTELYQWLVEHCTEYGFVLRYPEGKEELDKIGIKEDSKTYWESMNKLAAKFLGNEWEKISADDKELQVEYALDEMEAEDDFEDTLKELFGEKYSKNFFNENSVESPESSEYYGLAFHFDEMVYVVDFDVAKISKNELSGKLGFAGEFYFYYGGGEYGTWPTKELNEQMKTELGEENVVSGNFTTGAYVTKTMEEIMKEYEEYHKDDPTPAPVTTTPSTTAGKTDATSATSKTSSSSTTANSSNSAVATGQVSLVVILMVAIVAGIGVATFSRKKSSK